MGLFSDRSQMTSKCGKNTERSGTRELQASLSLMFLPVAPNDRFLGNICSEPSRMPKIFEPVPGCEIVGSAELRKGKHENKTGGNWGEQG